MCQTLGLGKFFCHPSLITPAQWLQQSFELQPGWNGIYLNVDATHATISELAQGSSVEEVWMWRQRLSTAQYFENPEAPGSANSRWSSWDSFLGDATSELKSMPANTAYLVKLGGSSNYTWNIVGRPVAPNSAQAPDGEKVVYGDAPVIVRGALDSSTLVYAKSALADGPQQWTLKPAGEFGHDRVSWID